MMGSMLSDGIDGSISSKRVVTLLAFLLCAAGFIANMVWGIVVDKEYYQSMMYIVIAGLGFTASEKFSRGSK